jgi:uncharacterized protein YkwD
MRTLLSSTALQPLERRVLLSGPSANEQEMLELINRLRTRPAQELPLILNSKDPDVQTALSFFKVDANELKKQWAALKPVAPLAWNDALARAALAHSQKMASTAQQSHQLPGESALLGRVTAAGYQNASFVGENVFAFMSSVFQGHAGFAIDWGNGPHGLQSPAGHRDNLMAGIFDEVGVSIIDAPAGKSVGPMLVTQDFGSRRGQNPFVLGAIYDDRNKDGNYEPGEGIGNVTVVASGKAGTFVTTSRSAGGYQMQLPPGTYSLTASGDSLKGLTSVGGVTIAGDNVKRDFLKSSFKSDVAAPVATIASIGPAKPGDYTQTFSITYTDNAAIDRSSLSNCDVNVTGPNGFVAPAKLVSIDGAINGPSRTATYRVNAPLGFFDSADNGQYSVNLQAKEVRDVNGNYAPATRIGTFNVNVPLAVLVPNGTLVVNGTPGNDAIDLSLAGNILTAKVNATSFTFKYAAVKRVYISAMAGNDAVNLAPGIMGSTIDGGPGNDTLCGNDGNDTLQGAAGNDVLMGSAGDDLLLGGDGADALDGGAGIDRAKKDPADSVSGVESLFD